MFVEKRTQPVIEGLDIIFYLYFIYYNLNFLFVHSIFWVFASEWKEAYIKIHQ